MTKLWKWSCENVATGILGHSLNNIKNQAIASITNHKPHHSIENDDIGNHHDTLLSHHVSSMTGAECTRQVIRELP